MAQKVVTPRSRGWTECANITNIESSGTYKVECLGTGDHVVIGTAPHSDPKKTQWLELIDVKVQGPIDLSMFGPFNSTIAGGPAHDY